MDEQYIAVVKAAVEAVAKDNTEAAFYYGKILSDQFYTGTGLKRFHGDLDYITTGEPAIVNGCLEEIFIGALPQSPGGDHERGKPVSEGFTRAPECFCNQGFSFMISGRIEL